MEDERCIIPRNVLHKADTFPVEFIAHFELDKRQIPYILIGGSVAAVIVANPALGTIYKIAIPIASIGGTALLSNVKAEGQHLENLLVNLFKFYGCKFKLYKLQKGGKTDGNKNIESRVLKPAIKKS